MKIAIAMVKSLDAGSLENIFKVFFFGLWVNA